MNTDFMMQRFTFLLTLSMLVNWALAQNIGIGTPSPDYNLDVNGTVGVNNYIYHNDDPDTWMSFPNNNQWEVVTGNQQMLLADGATNRLTINPTNSNIDLVILADGVDHLVSANTASRLIGIGTAAPNYLFDVNGNFRVMGDAIDHLLFVDAAADRVGVGTSTPAYSMDVSGDFRIMGDAVDHLFFADASTNRVGIGTNAPGYNLDVDGSFRIKGNTVDHLFYVDGANDRIGFGTNDPQSMLDIAGSISADNLRVAGNDLPFLAKLQEGRILVTQDSPSGQTVTVPLVFPTPFPAGVVPKVFMTVTNIENSSNRVFIASLKNLDNVSAQINVNTHNEDGTPWQADLEITWIAWD